MLVMVPFEAVNLATFPLEKSYLATDPVEDAIRSVGAVKCLDVTFLNG